MNLMIFIFGFLSLLFIIARIDDLHRRVLQERESVEQLLNYVSAVLQPAVQRACSDPYEDEDYDDEDYDDEDYDDEDYYDVRQEHANLKAQHAQNENHLEELRIHYIEEQVAALAFPEIEKQIQRVERALDSLGSPMEKSIQREQLDLLNTIYVLKDSEVSDTWTG